MLNGLRDQGPVIGTSPPITVPLTQKQFMGTWQRAAFVLSVLSSRMWADVTLTRATPKDQHFAMNEQAPLLHIREALGSILGR
jgi:hypothetical protein